MRNDFSWKDRSIIYVVSYTDKKVSNVKVNKIISVFNDIVEAKKYYAYCLTKYANVQIDTCRVYDSYEKKIGE